MFFYEKGNTNAQCPVASRAKCCKSENFNLCNIVSGWRRAFLDLFIGMRKLDVGKKRVQYEQTDRQTNNKNWKKVY